MTESVRFTQVTKQYRQGDHDVYALRELSLSIPKKQFVALVGASGSGKSTFLYLVAGLTRATSGQIHLNQTDVTPFNETQFTHWRRDNIALIFQSFNLIPTMTALENVMLPQFILGNHGQDIHQEAENILERVQLADRLHHTPDQLSGGQQQRVAIARALMSPASILLADEPTGNLDSTTGNLILDLLREMCREKTLIMVTHDENLAAKADRIIRLHDGQIEEDH